MAMLTPWTGRTACALQEAFRDSNESFAARLRIGVRTVAGWHQKPTIKPKSEMQQLLDTVLEQAPPPVKTRFTQLIAELGDGPDLGVVEEPDSLALAEADRRVGADPNIGALLEWLDRHAGWTSGTARRSVAERVAASDLGELHERHQRRVQVKQIQLAEALSAYYGTRLDEYGTYRGHCGDNSFSTSIVTRPNWLDLKTRLTIEADQLRLTSTDRTGQPLVLDSFAADQAVNRLSEAVAIETRIYDLPLYRLLDIDIQPGNLAGTVSLASFVEFALTLDLLASETVDALVLATSTAPGNLPLRDRYLPSLTSVVDVSSRLCAGGALALFAVARPESAEHPPDYLILVQERSGHVVNSPRRLSLTQGFHQPMIDYRAETRIALTLMRELEEEMFGREEVDNTVMSTHHGADPLHPTRLTRPMRWLTKAPDRLRIEATGFGLNLVNGNYEVANLIVVEDERFWDRFGGYVEANWEAGNLRRYSSQDRELIAGLVSDPAWTNEGLFTLLQGLRRLAELGPERVNLPAIEWTLG